MQIIANYIASLYGHSDAIYDLKIFENKLLSASADGFIAIWDIENNTSLGALAKTTSGIYAFEIINSLYIAVGNRKGHVHIIDVQKKTEIAQIENHTQPIFSLLHIPIHRLLTAASADGSIATISTDNWQTIQIKQISNKHLRNLTIYDNQIVVSSSDSTIKILDSPNLFHIHELQAHNNSVFCTAIMSSTTLVSGGRDAHLIFWNNNQNGWHIAHKIPAHNYTINKIAVHPNKPIFATASRDKTIKIWHKHTYELLKVINKEKYPDAHTHSVNTLIWFNEYLYSAGDDKKIIKWKIQTPS